MGLRGVFARNEGPVNPLDWNLMKGGPWLFRLLFGRGKPEVKRPGVDVAREV